MGEFDGVKTIVTGGSSGIGRATVQRITELGGSVVTLDLVPDEAPNPARALSCDISDAHSVDTTVEQAATLLDGLDVVVNCAGIGAQGDVEANSDDEWHRVFDVNVVGSVRVVRAALPHLRRSDQGAIVNVASVAVSTGLPDRALYSATKGAVSSLSRAMATDLLADGIRVNSVDPGTTHTPWITRLLATADDPDAELAALGDRQPHGRLVEAEEVADAIVYLASPRAQSTIGTTLAVDGGAQSLRPRT